MKYCLYIYIHTWNVLEAKLAAKYRPKNAEDMPLQQHYKAESWAPQRRRRRATCESVDVALSRRGLSEWKRNKALVSDHTYITLTAAAQDSERRWWKYCGSCWAHSKQWLGDRPSGRHAHLKGWLFGQALMGLNVQVTHTSHPIEFTGFKAWHVLQTPFKSSQSKSNFQKLSNHNCCRIFEPRFRSQWSR
jgi:hypothetical protein